MNNITGFQRMRRLQAEQKAKEAVEKANVEALESVDGLDVTNIGDDDKNAADGNVEPLNDPIGSITADDVNSLRVDEVKKHLDRLEIAYAHNTGEKKLREKLREALNGTN